ncbi:MAG: hypothetical protein HeimC2_14960 [Candidatus Heimdallarchaeota archaeon LC_2]|nr:MAG: hypothetical protein HeimC2_14960 [Candidatus Heimdallarchaeota archaeon LC_2]
MSNPFIKTLRLNILELLNYQKSRKLMKKLSDMDVLGQIHVIYSVSETKPSGVEVGEALIYLLDRNFIKELPLGGITVFAITEEGKKLLRGIYDGEDTAII